MKHTLTLSVLLAFVLHPSSFILAQGSLTPPGAPAPTMKTLAQVEPRTLISSAPFTITQPGSYYLTTNLVGASGQNGITISSGNVTLDLNGFALMGVPSSLRGVYVAGSYTNITVRNGTVSGWDSNGVDGYSTGSPRNLVFERLTVSANGGSGILTEAASVVRDCLSLRNIGYGIFSSGALVSGCVVRENGDSGILANSGTVSGCLVQNNGASGIYVNLPGSQVIGNTCIGNNTFNSAVHAGIYINDSNNRVEGNHVTVSGVAGIRVENSIYVNNVVIKNTVSGNAGNNYLGTAGNDFGPIGTAATATSPWANISH